MRIGSEGFEEYGRTIAFSAREGHGVRSRRDVRKDKLKKTIAALPWTIPEPPAKPSKGLKRRLKPWSI